MATSTIFVPPSLANNPATCLRILVVCRPPGQAARFARTFKSWGHSATICNGYPEAEGELARHRFEVALVDIDLDCHQGVAWLPRFRLLVPDLKIVAITDDPTIERERLARRESLALYLVRPVELHALEQMLVHLARKHGCNT